MFSKLARRSNFLFDPNDDLNVIRLIRSADLIKWYYATLKRSYCMINKHILVEDEKQLNHCIDDLKDKPFRGFSMVSFHAEFVNNTKTSHIKNSDS